MEHKPNANQATKHQTSAAIINLHGYPLIASRGDWSTVDTGSQWSPLEYSI